MSSNKRKKKSKQGFFASCLAGLLVALIKALKTLLDFLGQDDESGFIDTSQLVDNVGCWLGEPDQVRRMSFSRPIYFPNLRPPRIFSFTCT